MDDSAWLELQVSAPVYLLRLGYQPILIQAGVLALAQMVLQKGKPMIELKVQLELSSELLELLARLAEALEDLVTIAAPLTGHRRKDPEDAPKPH